MTSHSALQSRSLILNSLATFLEHATGSTTFSDPSSLWYLESSFSSKEAFQRFTSLHRPGISQQPSRVVWNADGNLADDDYWGTFDWVLRDHVDLNLSGSSHYRDWDSSIGDDKSDSSQVVQVRCCFLSDRIMSPSYF